MDPIPSTSSASSPPPPSSSKEDEVNKPVIPAAPSSPIPPPNPKESTKKGKVKPKVPPAAAPSLSQFKDPLAAYLPLRVPTAYIGPDNTKRQRKTIRPAPPPKVVKPKKEPKVKKPIKITIKLRKEHKKEEEKEVEPVIQPRNTYVPTNLPNKPIYALIAKCKDRNPSFDTPNHQSNRSITSPKEMTKTDEKSVDPSPPPPPPKWNPKWKRYFDKEMREAMAKNDASSKSSKDQKTIRLEEEEDDFDKDLMDFVSNRRAASTPVSLFDSNQNDDMELERSEQTYPDNEQKARAPPGTFGQTEHRMDDDLPSDNATIKEGNEPNPFGLIKLPMKLQKVSKNALKSTERREAVMKKDQKATTKIGLPTDCKLFQYSWTFDNGPTRTVLVPMPPTATDEDVEKMLPELLQAPCTIEKPVSSSSKPNCPPPRDSNEPIRVNPKQYHRIMARRRTRQINEMRGTLPTERQEYMHESRREFAKKRKRLEDGRFEMRIRSTAGTWKAIQPGGSVASSVKMPSKIDWNRPKKTGLNPISLRSVPIATASNSNQPLCETDQQGFAAPITNLSLSSFASHFPFRIANGPVPVARELPHACATSSAAPIPSVPLSGSSGAIPTRSELPKPPAAPVPSVSSSGPSGAIPTRSELPKPPAAPKPAATSSVESPIPRIRSSGPPLPTRPALSMSPAAPIPRVPSSGPSGAIPTRSEFTKPPAAPIPSVPLSGSSGAIPTRPAISTPPASTSSVGAPTPRIRSSGPPLPTRPALSMSSSPSALPIRRVPPSGPSGPSPTRPALSTSSADAPAPRIRPSGPPPTRSPLSISSSPAALPIRRVPPFGSSGTPPTLSTSSASPIKSTPSHPMPRVHATSSSCSGPTPTRSALSTSSATAPIPRASSSSGPPPPARSTSTGSSLKSTPNHPMPGSNSTLRVQATSSTVAGIPTCSTSTVDAPTPRMRPSGPSQTRPEPTAVALPIPRVPTAPSSVPSKSDGTTLSTSSVDAPSPQIRPSGEPPNRPPLSTSSAPIPRVPYYGSSRSKYRSMAKPVKMPATSSSASPIRKSSTLSKVAAPSTSSASAPPIPAVPMKTKADLLPYPNAIRPQIHEKPPVSMLRPRLEPQKMYKMRSARGIFTVTAEELQRIRARTAENRKAEGNV